MNPPCKDCITLSICRAKLNDATTKELMELADKCSILFHFLYFNKKDNVPFVTYSNIRTGSARQMQYNQLEYSISLLDDTLLKDLPFHHSIGFMRLRLYDR